MIISAKFTVQIVIINIVFIKKGVLLKNRSRKENELPKPDTCLRIINEGHLIPILETGLIYPRHFILLSKRRNKLKICTHEYFNTLQNASMFVYYKLLLHGRTWQCLKDQTLLLLLF